MIDAIIIASYFGIILFIGLRARRKAKGVSVDESKLVWYALFLSVALSLGLKWLVPDLAYFNRALLTIVLTFGVVAVPTVIQNGWRITVRDLVQTASPNVGYGALGLGVSLIAMHVFFH